METLLYFLTFITTILLTLILCELIFSRKKKVKERLESIRSINPLSEDEEAMRQPITDRLIKPAYQKSLKFISNAAPKEIRQRYEKMILHAGSPKNVTFASILVIQMLFSIFLGLLLYVLLSQTSNYNSVMIFFAMIFGFNVPLIVFRVKADKRRSQITRVLPDLLDLLYVSVEAGLAFDIAMKRTAEKMPGPLSEELNKTLDEIVKGRNREDALRDIVKRTGVADLSGLVTSIIQTEQLGSNISNMLRVQSNTMRQKRRQRAEEAARKIPVKMLIPLVFFIFPSLFIIVLGPALIRILETLGNVL